MEQYYKIAGLTVKMDSFGRTVQQAEPYLCEPCEKPDILIQTDWKVMQADQPHLSEEDCEYMCTAGSFYYHLLQHNGLMLHSSAVVVDGWAYLFSAPSGTGKSTHTGLWLQNFGERAYILNDDKPALRQEDGVWYAYGTPWSGKYDISVNARVPLAGIAIIERSADNRIEPIGGTPAIFAMMDQTVRPADPERRSLLLENLDKLLTRVPVWKLHCNMDPEAAQVSYNAMYSGRQKI